ncbi:DUF2637 domain-containing protein [Streptomyces sp. NPDC054796]
MARSTGSLATGQFGSAPRKGTPGALEAVGQAERAAPRCAGFAATAEVWVRRCCAVLVAGVAAYASYVHQRHFALQGGADVATATFWPLSVDGLLLLATLGLLNPARHVGRRPRILLWAAFFLGIGVSLAANIAAAPNLEWKPVLVAGWPPVALLLAVELLAHGAPPSVADTEQAEYDTPPTFCRRQTYNDPLVEQAAAKDAHHRKLHQRPISAETLRKELHVGAKKSRELVALLRANGSSPLESEHTGSHD